MKQRLVIRSDLAIKVKLLCQAPCPVDVGIDEPETRTPGCVAAAGKCPILVIVPQPRIARRMSPPISVAPERAFGESRFGTLEPDLVAAASRGSAPNA